MSPPPPSAPQPPKHEPASTAGDLESALRQAASAMEPPPAEAPPDDSGGRRYRLRDASVVLAAFAATVVLFDSEGLLTWAQRLDLGPGQSAALAVVRPLHAGLDRVGLTAPRQALQAVGARLGRSLGASEDPLLAGGWSDPSSTVAGPAAAPPDLALLDLVLAPEVAEAERRAAGPVQAEPVGEAEATGARPAGAATVLLIGDSMIAGSLGTELSKQLGKDSRLRVVSAFQTATGLSRPDVYDWMKVLPALLAREQPRLVIASFGANDAVDIRDGERTHEFGEAGWRRAYVGRVVAMMRGLAGERARVLWLGLPPMRDERFSKKATALNDLFARAARRTSRVEFLEVEMLLADPQGEYATFMRGADGRISRFRLDDGVHYSPAGARAITRWAVDWVKERLRQRRP